MDGFGQALGAPQRGPQIPEAGFKPPVQGMEGARPASPEEQELYNTFVAFSILALYDDKFMPKAIKIMKTANTPVEGVARVAATIAVRVYGSAKKQGKDLPGNVVLHAGKNVVDLVVEMAEASGVEKMTDEQVEGAFYLATDMFRSALDGQGLIDKAGVDADLEQFRQMDQSGELDAVAEQISGRKGPAPGGMAPPQGQAQEQAPQAPPEEPV